MQLTSAPEPYAQVRILRGPCDVRGPRRRGETVRPGPPVRVGRCSLGRLHVAVCGRGLERVLGLLVGRPKRRGVWADARPPPVRQRSRPAPVNQGAVSFVGLQGVSRTEGAEYAVELVERLRGEATVQWKVWVFDRDDLHLAPVGLGLIAPAGGRPRIPFRPHEVAGRLEGIAAAEKNAAWIGAEFHPLRVELPAIVGCVHIGCMKPRPVAVSCLRATGSRFALRPARWAGR